MAPIETKLSRRPEDYLKDRVEFKINAYSKRGDRNKYAYWAMASTAAVGSALVPVLINIDGVPNEASTIVSLIVAITVALDSIFHPRELWRNYDLIAAGLREEEMRYSTKTGPYTASQLAKGEDAFSKFVGRVEDKIAEERAETILTRTATPAESEGRNDSG